MRVLVVDDSSISRQMLSGVVQELGHACLIGRDGNEAWQIYEAERPDVVISDWVMPGLDGLELCRRIRGLEGTPYSYFVFVTAMSRMADLLQGMQVGADDFLIKPLDPYALQARLIAAERVTQLHRERNELLARREALLRSSRRFAAEADADTLLSDILAEATSLLCVDVSSIALWDEATQTLRQAYTQPATPPNPQHSKRADGILAKPAEITSTPPARITAPLLHEGHLLGTITVSSVDPTRQFSAADGQLLEMLAGVAAATLTGMERRRLEGVLLATRTLMHELNNHLAVAVGHCEMLSQSVALPEGEQSWARAAQAAAESASATLTRMLKIETIREKAWGVGMQPTIDLDASPKRT